MPESAAETARFNVWLGDGWPGPYVVVLTDKNDRKRTIVIEGAVSNLDALKKASEAFPELNSSDEYVGAEIKPAFSVSSDGHITPARRPRQTSTN